MSDTKQFVARGSRRLAVALYAITAVALVDQFGGGISQWGAIGIGAVTLGYYNTKYAELMSAVVNIFLEKYFGKKVQ